MKCKRVHTKEYLDGELISEYYDDIHEGVEEEQESNMCNNLVEKQQRHFNNRLNEYFWTKEEQLRNKHTHKIMVEVDETNWDACEKDVTVLRTNRKKVEDIIMIGDPVKMFEAVDAFEKMPIH